MSDTRICPYCSEEIKATAIKCKHCGERLDAAPDTVASTGGPAAGPAGSGPTRRGAFVHDAGPSAPAAAPSARAFGAPPPKLGSFILGAVLGKGAMGIVYGATHERLGNPVAIKVLPANLAGDPELMARFEQEARVQANLRHPNIVGVHDFVSDGQTFAFVMELVEGRTLADVIAQQGGPLPLARVLELTIPILNALGYAHGQGVVHRDIKPSNIMVARVGAEEVVKVADFGIAKAMGSARRTATGAMMGTLLYMSPEQLRGEKDLDARADLYSLGIMLYEMVVGRLPFECDTEYGLITAHLTQAPARPRAVRPELPEALEAVLLKALAKDRAARFASTAELRGALEQAAEAVARVPPAAPPARPAAPRPVQAGMRLGSYILGPLLGTGGMGAVYQAEHERLRQPVAVKMLAPTLVGDAALMGRFEQEARVQAQLRHPNIVGVHDFIGEGESYAFVMDLVEGETVEQLLREQGGPLPLARCASILAPVCDAIAFAHEHGVIHRDLKPSNIMLAEIGGREVVKVADFGIAKALGTERRTATGALVGTLRYMSPEQCRGAKDIDGRTDVYSLGLTLYEMVTGRLPFECRADYEVLTAQLTQAPVPPSAVRPGLPAPLEAVILKALAKEREARYPSATAFRDALLQAVASAGPEAATAVAPRAPAADAGAPLPGTVAVAAPPVLGAAAGVPRPAAAPPVPVAAPAARS
ncbi:MAG TPA: protein kinase, partial [Polyangia bacterium]